MRRKLIPYSPTLRVLAILSVTAIVITICVLSLMPTSDLPKVSGSDKLKHIIAYCALSAPLAVWIGPQKWLRAVVLAAAFGIGMEVAQLLIPTGRCGSYLDAIANTIGALAGAGLARLIVETE